MTDRTANDVISLTREQIADFTRTSQRKQQVKFLRQNGIRHYVDNNGWPVVTRAAVEGWEESGQARPAWKPHKAA